MANMGEGGHNQPVIKDKWGIRKLTLVSVRGFKVMKTIGSPFLAISRIHKFISRSAIQ